MPRTVATKTPRLYVSSLDVWRFRGYSVTYGTTKKVSGRKPGRRTPYSADRRRARRPECGRKVQGPGNVNVGANGTARARQTAFARPIVVVQSARRSSPGGIRTHNLRLSQSAADPFSFGAFVRGGQGFVLSTWVSGLKRAISVAVVKQRLWQPGFFDHVLRSSESYTEKWNYVRENPMRAGLVDYAADWPY